MAAGWRPANVPESAARSAWAAGRGRPIAAGDPGPTIRRLTDADLDEAAILLEAAYGRPSDWREELERYITLQPDGWFGADLGGQLAGTGGAFHYGPIASIGLMAVAPSRQRRGIGRAILDHVLAWLQRNGDPIPFLDASAAGEQLYEAAGFRDDGHTALWSRPTGEHPPAAKPVASRIEPDTLPEVAHFDAALFGADRSALLASYLHDVPGCAFLTRDAAGTITGYLFARPGRLGPWMATDPSDAEALLVAGLALPHQEPLAVRAPGQNPHVTSLLESYGFRWERSLRHMYRGSRPPPDRSCMYGEASFAVG